MSAPSESVDSPGFRTTRWSLVLSTARPGPAAQLALGELCETYWYPLYAFLRRGGESEEDSRDAVQSFVAELLEKGSLGGAAPDRGRFRAYLLGALRHHVANRRRHEAAERRGGGRATFSLSTGDAEQRYVQEPAHGETPEALFRRSWALLVLDRALARLRAEYVERGRGELYDALRPALTGEDLSGTYADVAHALDTSEGAIKVAVHRLRARMRELVREEVAHTVDTTEDVEGELRELFAALSGETGSI